MECVPEMETSQSGREGGGCMVLYVLYVGAEE